MADEFVDYVEVFEGKDKQWYYRAKSNNGEVLLTSEGYTEKATALSSAAKAFSEVQVKVESEETPISEL